jgi:hypothetical protein
LVLSADYLAIMKNEGSLYDGLEAWDRERRIRGFKEQFRSGSIKPQTNSGVRIGMTEAQVRRILGAPRQTLYSKKFAAREFVYRREQGWSKSKRDTAPDGTGMSWRNYYLFRNGRLFYVELAQDLEGGA